MVRPGGLRRFVGLGGVAAAGALMLAIAIPASAAGGYQTDEPSLVDLEVPGSVQPLINSGEDVFGTVFEGLPDGIGVAPGPGKPNNQGYVDLYVTHEQSHVPFGGEGNSGLGRFNGDWAIAEFTTDHTIGVKRL